MRTIEPGQDEKNTKTTQKAPWARTAQKPIELHNMYGHLEESEDTLVSEDIEAVPGACSLPPTPSIYRSRRVSLANLQIKVNMKTQKVKKKMMRVKKWRICDGGQPPTATHFCSGEPDHESGNGT